MKRVLVVDDHTAVREGIRRLLEDLDGAISVAEVGTAEAALAKVDSESFDLVILDLSMPGKGGLDAIADLRQSRFAPPVLVLSMYPAESVGVRVLRMGANGYITKGESRAELERAILAVGGGGHYMPGGLAERILGLGGDAPPAHDALSDREFRVLHLMARGLSVSEVSYELEVSVKTVSACRSRILNRLGLDSNAAMIRYAMEHGLIE